VCVCVCVVCGCVCVYVCVYVYVCGVCVRASLLFSHFVTLLVYNFKHSLHFTKHTETVHNKVKQSHYRPCGFQEVSLRILRVFPVIIILQTLHVRSFIYH